jgi:hypothetical protein
MGTQTEQQAHLAGILNGLILNEGSMYGGGRAVARIVDMVKKHTGSLKDAVSQFKGAMDALETLARNNYNSVTNEEYEDPDIPQYKIVK